MNKKTRILIWLGVMTLTSSFSTTEQEVAFGYNSTTVVNDNLEKAALDILDKKCNVCHRKQNPFMVFREQNISKRSKKIYQAVFVKQTMPKGDKIRLTAEEYSTLEKWLSTQQIF